MPEKTILGPYKIDPAFDRAKAVNEEVKKAREFYADQIRQIDAITERNYQLLCLFSLIESLAQEKADYPIRGESDVFCRFILKYQTRYDYLNEVEPVTFYYDVEENIEDIEIIPDYLQYKSVSLDGPWLSAGTLVKDYMRLGKTEEVIQELRKTRTENEIQKKLEDHRLVKLLYRLRSKVTHELSSLGDEFPLFKPVKYDEPYYRDVSRIYVENGNRVSDHVYELVIPNSFIRNILLSCIENYLKECISESYFPFENNSFMRRFRIAWYDK